MRINGIEYGYTIEPNNNRVRAEIYKKSKSLINLSQKNVRINLIDKTFGKWYRKPVKEDYKKAKEWAEDQMRFIFHANK
jgi:hypothetical protein